MTAENTGIRFVIIGYGHIGQRYADLILKQNGAELVGIVDVKITSASVEVPYYSSIEALLDDQLEFDVAVIATPNGLHVEQSIQLLNAGKHVIVEKPISLDTAGVEKIYEAANRNQKSVFPVFQNRYAIATNWLKELLDSKQLGEIFMVQVNCFWNRDEAYYSKNHWHGTKELDGGVLYTQFSHYIDALIWLFGSISVKSSELFNFKHQQTEIEDSGVVQFGFGEKSTGTLTFSTATFAQNYESSILIIAENGTLKLGGQYMDRIVSQHAVVDFPIDLGQEKTNHELFLKDVVQKLQSGSASPIQKSEVYNTIALIERIYQNAKNSRDVENSPIFAS